MSEHYFSNKPTAEHNEKNIRANFFGRDYIFKTDSGVFSKNRVDFGTSLLIKSFEMPDDAYVLDLGCGYGPIGVVISSNLKKGKVVLTDVNERAIQLARENIKLNQNFIGKDVEVIVKQSFSFNNLGNELFDYILLNPPIRTGKAVIYQMFEEAIDYLKDNGELWIVIQKKQGAESAINKLSSLYKEVIEVDKDKGYVIVKSVK